MVGAPQGSTRTATLFPYATVGRSGVSGDGPRAVGWGRQPPRGLRRPPSRPPTISVTGSMTGVNSGGSGRGVVGTGGGSVVDGAGGGDVVPGGREVDDVDGPDGDRQSVV